MISADDFIVELLQSQGMVTDAQVEAARERVKDSEDSSVLDGLYEIQAISEQ